MEIDSPSMTDEERERRYIRFFGEGMAKLWAILDSPGGAQFWGKRLEGYGLGVLQQAMEEASRRKGKEPTKEPPPPRETERHKIQREEEQGNSQPPPEPEPGKMEEEASRRKDRREEEEPEQVPPKWDMMEDEPGSSLPHPPPEWEKIQGEEDQGNSQPPLLPDPEPIQGEQEPGSLSPHRPPEWEMIQWQQQEPIRWFEEEPNQEDLDLYMRVMEEDNPATSIYGTWMPRPASPSVTRSTFDLPPYYQDPDPEAPHYFDDMAEFYLEAARRLPIAQMPKLARYLSLGGLLLGLNDPVTNIIVNAIYLMGSSRASDVLPAGVDPVRHAADRASYVDIARKSRAALVTFMTFYFRHLTQDQAKRYLSAANHDLVLAISLVEQHRKGSLSIQFEVREAWPHCSRTKIALRYAARAAMLLHDPDDLVRVLTSSFPYHLLNPVLNNLRREEKEQLSVGWVNDTLNLLQHPWSPPQPPPAPTPGTFRDADGNVTIIVNIGQDLFSTTTITRDHVATLNNEGNGNGNLVTTSTISRHPSSHGDHDDDHNDLAGYIHLFTGSIEPEFDCLLCTTDEQLRSDMNLVMMCLLDDIHSFYIEALSMLPSDHRPRLLHALLAAGYCYGVMDNPVHNIIINSIWYSLHYPLPKDETVQIQYTSSMSRIASCSLHALIAIIQDDAATISKKNDAVSVLARGGCCVDIKGSRQIVNAAHATRHPQPSVLVEFMELLLPLRGRLSSLLTHEYGVSNADFETICNLIETCKAPVPTISNLCQPSSMDPDCWVQAYVHKKLEELLLNHGRKYPLEPQYKLGIICGVASKICSSYHRGTTCYHANFFASTGDAPASSPGWSFFFAEFWNKVDDDFEQSTMPPVCCPVPHLAREITYCRCFICESAAVRIVHPFDVNYFMGHEVSTDSLCAIAEHEAALDGFKMEFVTNPSA
ncbi:uncharacterized protein [Lolium perenne]|uniref:uncharacterized protein n=1 Tax=Lolium perenne TaxID=4522 RepID=UPI0021EA3E44|nr:uncharacterized protein LOC127291998 [Lolium perenne]XP_051177303.1 uncharacterized protein LOC127291998 [Lolium perenne]